MKDRKKVKLNAVRSGRYWGAVAPETLYSRWIEEQTRVAGAHSSVRLRKAKTGLAIETDCYAATVTPAGAGVGAGNRRTGVAGGTFLDKKTGARDLGFGVNVTDYPCVAPNAVQSCREANADPALFGTRRLYVGVEGPQLCSLPESVPLAYEIIRGASFGVVHQWTPFTQNCDGSAGSRWDEWLVFPGGKRHFFAVNQLTSAASYNKLSLAGDWPGHIVGDEWKNVYLSYHGVIPKREFAQDFPPDTRFFFQRDSGHTPQRMIRAYQPTIGDRAGPWLGSLTLDPGMMCQAWCHRRGYICMIGFLGGLDVRPGASFTNVNLLGYFDSIGEMEDVYDRHVRTFPRIYL